MRKILTGIDIGSRLIKIVVCESTGNKTYVLAANSTRSRGIKDGLIVDLELAVESLKQAINEVEEMLGFKLDKAIVSIPTNNSIITITEGNVEVMGNNNTIDLNDVLKCLQDACIKNNDDDYNIVTVSPIGYKIDNNDDLVKDPIGKSGINLNVKVVIGSSPKELISSFTELCKRCNIDVTDYVFSSVADYSTIRDKNIDTKVGALINIGYDKINVSIFNKGIMIKDEIIDTGSRTVDQDLMYMYKLKRSVASDIKTNFSYAISSCANNESVVVKNKDDLDVTISNMESTQVIESRLKDLLGLAMKQINILTKRELSYIIVSGGISEMHEFNKLVKSFLGEKSTTMSIKTMGIRSNIYSNSYGSLLYLIDKLEFRNQDFSVVSSSVETASNNQDITNESILNKVFGYFFDK